MSGHALEKRLQIAGSVAGVPACYLASDKDEVVVGSRLDCDLVAPDPLVPARAFRVTCVKTHRPGTRACAHRWWLRAEPGVRVFVNGTAVRRAPLAEGDRIELGCHKLTFGAAPEELRSVSGRADVDDLCEHLLHTAPPPSMYRRTRPSSANRKRLGRAAAWAGLALLPLLLLLFTVSPAPPKRSTQQPVKVTRVAEVAPDRPAPRVTSLEKVEKQRRDAPPRSAPPKLADAERAELEMREAELTRVASRSAGPTAPQRIETGKTRAGPNPERIALAGLDTQAPPPEHDPGRLERSSGARRKRVTRAPAEAQARKLVSPEPRNRPQPAQASFRDYAKRPRGAREPAVPATPEASGRSVKLASLDPFEASAVSFEQHQGNRIPVADPPDELAALESEETGGGDVTLDGKVTKREVASSWKSGNFKFHRPGDPPAASPKTFCYVAKVKRDGAAMLYVSFLCKDPRPGRIEAGQNPLVYNDSVEIFLDTDFDRTDYRQLIITSRGRTKSMQYPRPMMKADGPRPWRAKARVQTRINREAKQWVAEILIPFSRLGGVPDDGERWAVNFARNFRGQDSGSNLQTWFLVYDEQRNYHNPELFGEFAW